MAPTSPPVVLDLDTQTSPPPRGLGPLLLLLLTWLLPAAVASVLRAAVGFPLWVGALAGGGMVVGVWAWAVSRRKVGPTDVPLALLQGLFLVAVLGLTWRMLGIPVLGGLVSVGGGDAGNHAALRADFVTHSPHIYEGFTFFHTVTYGLEQLFGLDTFASFRAAFFLVPTVLALVLTAALESTTARLWRSARSMRVAQGALLLSTAGVWSVLVLRLLHYHQADGFYAHLFGLVPLGLAWIAYALPGTDWVRCAALIAGVVLYRFTYGLNLGDLLVACGVLILREPQSWLAPRFRGLVGAVGLMVLGAAVHVYGRLLPLAHTSGGFLPYAYERALRVQGWAWVGLAVLRFLSPRDEPVERRLLDFALLFGGSNVLIQHVYLQQGLPTGYYFLKYGFHAVVLLVMAWLLVVGNRVGAWFQVGRSRDRRWDVALALLTVLGLVEVTRGWSRAFAAYTPGFEERVRGQPPFQSLDALEDRGGTALIRQVLHDGGKRFGGLLSPSWPRTNFTNVVLGWVPENALPRNGHWSLFNTGGVREEPGACVFWEASPEDWAGYRRATDSSPALEARVLQLHARPDKVCREYAAPWVVGGSRTLCYRCD